MTCGYIVDWVRSCYLSRWRLFEGSNIETPGRYYFAPAGAPHYPGWHNFWSRNWTTDEFIPAPHLGELEGNRPYSKGGLQTLYPPAVRLGSADCIENGERLPLPVLSRHFIEGIDSRCYPPSAAPEPPTELCCCDTLTSDQIVNGIISAALTSGSDLVDTSAWPISYCCACSSVTSDYALEDWTRTTAICGCSELTNIAAWPVTALCSCDSVTSTAVDFRTLLCGCSALGSVPAFPVSSFCACSALGATRAFPVTVLCSCSSLSSTHTP